MALLSFHHIPETRAILDRGDKRPTISYSAEGRTGPETYKYSHNQDYYGGKNYIQRKGSYERPVLLEATTRAIAKRAVICRGGGMEFPNESGEDSSTYSRRSLIKLDGMEWGGGGGRGGAFSQLMSPKIRDVPKGL